MKHWTNKPRSITSSQTTNNGQLTRLRDDPPSGVACSSGAEKGSHVLEAIKADPDRKSIRFSFSHYNTLEEVDFVVEKLKAIVPVKEVAYR